MSINFTCFNLEGGDRVIKDTKYFIVKIYLILIYYLYDLLEYVFTKYSCCLYINEKYILS